MNLVRRLSSDPEAPLNLRLLTKAGLLFVHPERKAAVAGEVMRGALAVYTDDEKLPLPEGWRRIPVAVFARSYIIYTKYHEVHLYRIESGDP